MNPLRPLNTSILWTQPVVEIPSKSEKMCIEDEKKEPFMPSIQSLKSSDSAMCIDFNPQSVQPILPQNTTSTIDDAKINHLDSVKPPKLQEEFLCNGQQLDAALAYLKKLSLQERQAIKTLDFSSFQLTEDQVIELGSLFANVKYFWCETIQYGGDPKKLAEGLKKATVGFQNAVFSQVLKQNRQQIRKFVCYAQDNSNKRYEISQDSFLAINQLRETLVSLDLSNLSQQIQQVALLKQLSEDFPNLKEVNLSGMKLLHLTPLFQNQATGKPEFWNCVRQRAIESVYAWMSEQKQRWNTRANCINKFLNHSDFDGLLKLTEVVRNFISRLDFGLIPFTDEDLFWLSPHFPNVTVFLCGKIQVGDKVRAGLEKSSNSPFWQAIANQLKLQKNSEVIKVRDEAEEDIQKAVYFKKDDLPQRKNCDLITTLDLWHVAVRQAPMRFSMVKLIAEKFPNLKEIKLDGVDFDFEPKEYLELFCEQKEGTKEYWQTVTQKVIESTQKRSIQWYQSDSDFKKVVLLPQVIRSQMKQLDFKSPEKELSEQQVFEMETLFPNLERLEGISIKPTVKINQQLLALKRGEKVAPFWKAVAKKLESQQMKVIE